MDALSPNTIIGLVVALFTVLGFLKSFFRFFFNLIALALGALVGLWVYNNGIPIAQTYFPNPAPWMPTALGISAGVLTLLIIRSFLNFLSGKSGSSSPFHTGGSGFSGAVFGLILGSGITYFALTAVRYAGTTSELNRLQAFLNEKIDSSSKEPLFLKLKTWLDSSPVGQWHQKFDFINDPEQTNAAKLAIVNQDPTQFALLINSQKPPKPGQEFIPEALPVDPELTKAYQQHNYKKLLKDPELLDQILSILTEEQLRNLDIERTLGLKK